MVRLVADQSALVVGRLYSDRPTTNVPTDVPTNEWWRPMHCPIRTTTRPAIKRCERELGKLVVCDNHARRVAVALGELPMYYVLLSLMMEPGSTISPANERVAVTKTPPLAIDPTSRALQEDMLRVVNVGEREHRADMRYSRQPRRGREGRQLDGAVTYLTAHLETLLAREWGTIFADELLALERSIRGALGLDRLVHKLPAPCPTCDMVALERDNGADRVICRYCRRTFTEDDYARLVLILTSGAA